MKSILLFCNSGSGDAAHSAKKLQREIEAGGFRCATLSHKQTLKSGKLKRADLYAVAGGDGTMKQFVRQLLDLPLKYVRPIGLLPLGTANNIAGTLRLDPDNNGAIIESWHKEKLKAFDIGMVKGLKKREFFLESMGYGIFPRLMEEMSARPVKEEQTQEEEFDRAFKMLLKITQQYKASPCTLVLDGKHYPGRYLMIHFMNIQALGSNMRLAPDADPGDNLLDVIMVPESGRDTLADYFENARRDKSVLFPFESVKAKHIEVRWEGKDVHMDDTVIHPKGKPSLTISLLPGLVHMLVSK